MEFEIRVKEKDLYAFQLHHTYRNMSGLIGLAISIAAFIYLIWELAHQNNDPMKIMILIIGSLLFTVVNPIMLKSKAKAQIKRTPSFQKPLNYSLEEEKLVIKQEEEQVEVPWNEIVKVIETKSALIVYLGLSRAFIWPKNQLSEIEKVKATLVEKLEVRKIKFKR